jgi:hypothetical protein
MSATMEDEIKRWTAKRKAALVLEIIQGKTTVAEASRSSNLVSTLDLVDTILLRTRFKTGQTGRLPLTEGGEGWHRGKPWTTRGGRQPDLIGCRLEYFHSGY